MKTGNTTAINSRMVANSTMITNSSILAENTINFKTTDLNLSSEYQQTSTWFSRHLAAILCFIP